jgi:hypothetical protein
MKYMDSDTILRKTIVWISDFVKVNNRHPDSLDDLKNNSLKEDYDLKKVFEIYEKNGFTFHYQLNGIVYEIAVVLGDKKLLYKSDKAIFYIYSKGVLSNEYNL